MSVAGYATGKSPGPDPKFGRVAIGRERTHDKEPRNPTVTELMPPAYCPNFVELGFMTVVGAGQAG